MKNHPLFLLILNILLLTLFTNCENTSPKIIDILSYRDITPPALISINGESSKAFTIKFNEKLNDRFHTTVYFQNKKTTNFLIDNNEISIISTKDLIPGKQYEIKVEVEDLQGNSTRVDCSPYAKNNNKARLLISEFNTKGTRKYGDRVELIVVKRGNLAGLCLSDGFNNNYNDRCVFPSREVYEGELIIVSFQEGISGDFYSKNLKGLSSFNGCLLILDSPETKARIQDCVIYSNKSSKTNEGLGNKNILNTAKLLSSNGDWEESSPICSSAVDSNYSTSTRTINRKVDKLNKYIDTNSAEDFYTTITSGQSFGELNNKKEYHKE